MPEQQDTFTGKLSLRSNYAMIHYRAAAQAARVTHAVEQANDTSKHGAWFDEVMMHVPVAVIMAAAALEANANEIIQDNLDQLPSSPRRELLKDLISERSGSAMEKYRRLALLLDKLPDQGSAVWQNADLLIRFRNFFVHFKPSWDHEIGVHEEGKLSRQLRARLPIVEAYKSGFMLPYGVLNYACAKWAVASAKDFCADFSSMTGVQDRWRNGGSLHGCCSRQPAPPTDAIPSRYTPPTFASGASTRPKPPSFGGTKTVFYIAVAPRRPTRCLHFGTTRELPRDLAGSIRADRRDVFGRRRRSWGMAGQ